MNIDRCFLKDKSYDLESFVSDFQHFASSIVKSNEKTENKLQKYFEQDHYTGDSGEFNGNGDRETSRPRRTTKETILKSSNSHVNFEMNICDVLVANSIDVPTKNRILDGSYGQLLSRIRRRSGYLHWFHFH